MSKINNSYRNMCIVHDVKLGFDLDEITSKTWVKELANRV